MGCSGSKDAVITIANTPRRHSLPERPSSTARKAGRDGVFSRPGSGPVASLRGGKASVSPMTAGGDAEGGLRGKWTQEDDLSRKQSAQSKSSADSGIGLGERSAHSAPLKPLSTDSQSQGTPGQSSLCESKGVPRLSSTISILNELNEMGIVPKTNRNMSSLAFHIDMEDGEKRSRSGKPAAMREPRKLPPLPRLAPAANPVSITEIEEKQRRAEERRRKREEKLKRKAAKLGQRRVSESEVAEKEEEFKEKVSTELQQKLQASEANRERIRLQQLEKKQRNEEKLLRVRQNREKLLLSSSINTTDEDVQPELETALPTDRRRSTDSNSGDTF